ncbi:hypothetical protein Bca4012_036349 [Brassica carinata]
MHSLPCFLEEADNILSEANSVGSSTLQLDKLQRPLTSLFEGLWSDTWGKKVWFELMSDNTASQLEERVFRIALGLLKQETTPECIRKLAFQLIACLTKRGDLATQFLGDGYLKEVFKKTVYQTEAAVIVRHLLEVDPHTLQSSMVLELKQMFNQMETLAHKNWTLIDWNLCSDFAERMAHTAARGPSLFLQTVVSICELGHYSFDDGLYIELSKTKMDTQVRIYSEECSQRHENISANFITVLHELADTLLSLFAEPEKEKMEGATIILNLLRSISLIYVHSVGVLVHRDMEISSGSTSAGIFYTILRSALLTSPTIGCKHELSEEGSSFLFLLAVCRRSMEGHTRVMEALLNLLRDFLKSSLIPDRNFAHIATFLEKVLGASKTLDASIGRALINSLIEMVKLLDTKDSEAFPFLEHALGSLKLISKAYPGHHSFSPSEVMLCDVDSINFEDGNQKNLFSFREPLTFWKPIEDGVDVDLFSSLLELRMYDYQEEQLFHHAQPSHEDEVDDQQHIKQEHQPLLSSDDLLIFLHFVLKVLVDNPQILADEHKLVKTQVLLSGLMEQNGEHFARFLLDVLHAENKTSTGDQVMISCVIFLLRRLVTSTKLSLEVFLVKDLSLLLKLLNLESEELLMQVVDLLRSVVSHATIQVEDERSKCSLDELQPSDLQILCLFFCKKGLSDDLFFSAYSVMLDLSRSHETHREIFVQRLSNLALQCISERSLGPRELIDLLHMVNSQIKREDIVRLNLDLQTVWEMVFEAIDFSGERTELYLSVFESFFRFCEITEEDHLKFAELHKVTLNQLLKENIYLLDDILSLLWKTPEVIDFASKRKYFKAKVFENGSSHSKPTLKVSVQRKQAFIQTYSLFESCDKLDVRSSIHVIFEGEEGYDCLRVNWRWLVSALNGSIGRVWRETRASVCRLRRWLVSACLTEQSERAQPA